MIRQRLKGRSISPLNGILMILGIIASIILVSWIERAIKLSTGSGAGALVWILVVAEAAAVARLGIMELCYTVTDDRFFVERVYGDHARIVHDIPLESIMAVGGRDEIFEKYGNGQSYEKATVGGNNTPLCAIAYRRENGSDVKLLVFQPDNEIMDALRRQLAGE